jgi:hypothetical protein
MPKKYHYTYSITNKVNNKKYIGARSASILPVHDLGYHYFSSSSNEELIEEQKKNSDSFLYEIINEHISREEALAEEVYLHKLYDVASNPNFYNKARQTSSKFYYDFTGSHHSEETKRKIGAASKGRKASPETIQKMIGRVPWNKGRTLSDKERQSYAGENNSMFGKRGKNSPNYGRRHTNETKQKQREAKLGKKASAETKAKMSDSRKGVKNHMKGIINPMKLLTIGNITKKAYEWRKELAPEKSFKEFVNSLE